MLKIPSPPIPDHAILSGDRKLILKKLMHFRIILFLIGLPTLILLDQQGFWVIDTPPLLTITLWVLAWTFSRLMLIAKATPNSLMWELLFDLVWITWVVFYSGRSANPFIYYLLVPLAIGAVFLNKKATWCLAASSIFIYSFLLFMDLSAHFNHIGKDFKAHLLGMWINFVLSACLICYFINLLAMALRDHQHQMREIRENTLKSEQILGIGTLAATTVHALGTPLSTLTLLLDELKEQTPIPHMDVMLQQIQRCKSIMQKLSKLADHDHNLIYPKGVQALMTDIKEHYDIGHPLHSPLIDMAPECAQAVIQHSYLLQHALINLIDNALHASSQFCRVTFYCTSQHLTIDIQDDGPGLNEDALKNWGKLQKSSKKDGLGIGAFLASSTIESMGGAIEIQRLLTDNTKVLGAHNITQIRVTLPLIPVTVKSANFEL